jgi:tRNA threonylcarbamoyl adenosine modification protein YeaZ
MLLAIDTSAGTGVAVVDRDRGVIAQGSEADTRRHAEVIGELIRLVLDQSGVPLSAMSGIVAGMGPGPFTGLRVGIAAANAVALAAAKPVVRVVSHDGVAWGHYADGGSGPLLVVTDARRRELYWSAYAGADEHGLPIRVHGPSLSRPDDIPVEYAGFTRVDAAEVAAGSLGMLAEGLYLHGGHFEGPEPLYLRAPDAVVPGPQKRVS